MSQREEPREGRDLQITCVANKYLYTSLSWYKVIDTKGGYSSGSALSNHRLTSGEFSNFLVLFLNNLTVRDSGAYRCSAHHLITGQETHLDTHVVVTSEYCSHKFDLFFILLLLSFFRLMFTLILKIKVSECATMKVFSLKAQITL